MNPNERKQTLSNNRKRYVSKAGWYSLSYPNSWVVQEAEECSTFTDPKNGVGALQISAYETPTPQNAKDTLLEYLSDNDVYFDEREITLQVDDGRSTASYSYTQGLWFKRVWFVSEGNRLLMITYNCKSEHQGKEDGAVEEIVRSLVLDSEAAIDVQRGRL